MFSYTEVFLIEKMSLKLGDNVRSITKSGYRVLALLYIVMLSYMPLVVFGHGIFSKASPPPSPELGQFLSLVFLMAFVEGISLLLLWAMLRINDDTRKLHLLSQRLRDLKQQAAQLYDSQALFPHSLAHNLSLELLWEVHEGIDPDGARDKFALLSRIALLLLALISLIEIVAVASWLYNIELFSISAGPSSS